MFSINFAVSPVTGFYRQPCSRQVADARGMGLCRKKNSARHIRDELLIYPLGGRISYRLTAPGWGTGNGPSRPAGMSLGPASQLEQCSIGIGVRWR